jgi:DNA repair exonuclease SbcCD ATPase subunit
MEFYVNFSLDCEFDETLSSPMYQDLNYSSLSEGEKLRVDLSLLFTWREVSRLKNSVNTNLLILDEIFDSSLDGFGSDEFIKIIRYEQPDSNIFVISHKEGLEDKFGNVLQFEKIGGFSRVKPTK